MKYGDKLVIIIVMKIRGTEKATLWYEDWKRMYNFKQTGSQC